MSLKCVRICALIFFVSLLCPLPSFAQQGGPSGLVQYTYQKTDTKDIGAESELSSFTQLYNLGYQGDIYDPRLLLYNVGGSFEKQDSRVDGSMVGGESTNSAENRDYNFKLDFIQGTKYPFTIYREKVDQPVWTVLPEQTFLTKVTADRYGLSGTALLSAGTNLKYDFHHDDTKTAGLLQQTDQDNKGLSLGVDSRHGESYINTSYSYQQNLERVTGRYDEINDAKVAFGLKPGTNTRLNMDTSYYDDSYTKFADASTTMNFNYTPSSDFNSNLSVNADRIKQGEETGNFASLLENAAYKISPFVTTNANLMFDKNEGAFENDSTQSLTLGLGFTKPLPDGTTVSADTSANGTSGQFNKKINRDSVFFSLGGSVSKNFTATNTEINAGGSYYNYASSLGGRNTTSGFNVALINRFFQNLTFQSHLNFSDSNIVNDEIDLASIVTPTVIPVIATITPTAAKTRNLISDNSLEYVMQLGDRGNLGAKAGALFESGTNPRNFYYAGSTFMYVPRSSLSLNAGLNYYKESLSQTRTASGSLGVDYRVRSITMSLKNEVWQENGPLGVRRRSSVLAQVSRPF